ncbi:MAG: TraM recognition domain-containing protein, partial [bacterium]|nr:TraM recognition domain-containing protein [bacterium]
FKKVWVDAWSARMEYILSNALLALLEFPGATLLGVNRIFADKNYRSLIVNNVTDPSVKAFWLDEYAKYSDKFATEATAAIQNKVGQFAANPLIRNMVGQSKSTFDIRKVMDERKILIVNLSKGRMGEGNANLVGSMLITKIYLAAMSRADVGAEVVRGLPPFYLYVDEFQSFANESFADILSEARKYKLSLTIAHQYIEQMSEEVRAAVFGNVGTMCSFRVGAFDAEVLEKEYAPAFIAEDMVNLGFAQIYLKLMINGVGSAPFSATTLNRPPFPSRMYTNEVIAASRAQFGRSRTDVEEEIKKWHEPIPELPRDPNAPPVPETRKYAQGTRPLRPAPVGASASYTGVLSRPAVPPKADTMGPRQDVLRGGPSVARSSYLDVGFPSDLDTRRPSSGDHGGLSAYQSHLPEIPPPILPAVLRTPAPPSVREEKVGRPPDFTQREETHQPFRGEFTKMQAPEREQGTVSRLNKERPPAIASTPAPHDGGLARPNPPAGGAGAGVFRRDNKSQTPSPQAPASLSMLKFEQKKDKGPSTQNLFSLKTLIDAAFRGGDEKSKNEQTTLPPTENQRTQNASAPTVPATPPSQLPKVSASLLDDIPQSQNPKEIPEDVLRGVLAD